MTATIRKILLPTDFSPCSERAIEYSAALAKRLGTSVHLIHTLDGPTVARGLWDPAVHDARRRDRAYHAAKGRLAEVAQRLLPLATAVSAEVREGDAAEEIIKAAVDYGCDLVVMATHGRTGLPHLVMGSVAEAVIREAPCPVLTVRQSGAARVSSARRVA
jgi:nucleotide-binding universal stress UspA family protein